MTRAKLKAEWLAFYAQQRTWLHIKAAFVLAAIVLTIAVH